MEWSGISPIHLLSLVSILCSVILLLSLSNSAISEKLMLFFLGIMFGVNLISKHVTQHAKNTTLFGKRCGM
jgi:hypothetical protein